MTLQAVSILDALNSIHKSRQKKNLVDDSTSAENKYGGRQMVG